MSDKPVTINGGELRRAGGSAVVSYPIDPAALEEMASLGLFHFQEGFFENSPLGIPFQTGRASIIGEDVHAAEFAAGQPFEVTPGKWNVLSVELDGVVYPTFISLRLDGKLPGSLKEAMAAFAVRKGTQGEDVPAEGQRVIQDALNDLMDLGAEGDMSEPALGRIAEKAIAGVAGLFEKQEARQILEKHLSGKGIPYDEHEGSYFFTVSTGEDTWHVECELLDWPKELVLYSYVSLEIDERLYDELLRDLNQLNLALARGNFQFDTDDGTLFYRSHLYSSVFDLAELLEDLFSDNFDGMRAVFPVLREKYAGRIGFEE